MKHIMNSIFENFGRCGKCMRLSFLVAAAAWGCALVVAYAMDWPAMAIILGMVAACLTALWFMHLVIFATRETHGMAHQAEMESGEEMISRRRMLATFSKSLIFVAVATSIPMSSAMAAQSCTDCEKSQGACLKGCEKLSISEQPQCQKNCMKQWPCVPNRDCT